MPLFHRHARGLVLTEQGELLFDTAKAVMSKLHTAETLLSDAKTKPAGELRITCPVGFGTVWVTQRMPEFMELYPDIRVELILNDDQVDIAMRAADAAIWTREPEQSDLIRRKLFTMRVRAFASAQYVRRYGAPQSLKDLDNGDHRFVSHSGMPAYHLSLIQSLETLERDGEEPRVPAFRVNSVMAMKYAIRSGLGVGLLPDYLTEEEKDLLPVLNEVQLPTVPIIFVYPEELRASKKVQVLRDFLVSQARSWKY